MLFDHILLFLIVIGLCCGVAFVILLMKYPRFAYISLFLSIVAGQLGRISLGTDIRGGSAIIATDLIVILIAFAWIIKKIVYDRIFSKTPLATPILLFCGVALLSYFVGLGTLMNVDSFDLKTIILSFSYWFRFVAYALLYFFSRDFLAKNKTNAGFLFKLIFTTSILVSITGFIQLLVMPDFTEYAIKYGWDPHQDRLLGTFFDPNFIGTYFAMVLALGLSMYPSATKVLKTLIIFSILFCSLALLLTFSRTGYVAFFSAFLIIGALRSPKLLVIGFICMSLAVVASPRAIQRITAGLSVDETGLKRVYSWDKGLRIIANHPVLGVGYNNLAQVQSFYALVDEFDVNNRSGLENTFLTVLVTTGLAGGISYLWLWFTLIKDSFFLWFNRKLGVVERNLGLGLGTAFVALVVSSIFMNSLLYPFLLVHIWILASFLPFSHASKTIH